MEGDEEEKANEEEEKLEGVDEWRRIGKRRKKRGRRRMVRRRMKKIQSQNAPKQ